MGVAAVGLVAHALFSGGGEARTEVAVSAPAVEAVAAQAPLGGAAVAAGDSQREYVFAHQAMTAGGPMPDAIQYVRTVSEVRPDSGR
jgi:sigma-E factor negative regulatory protein RseA